MSKHQHEGKDIYDNFHFSGEPYLKNGSHIAAIERYHSGQRFESRIQVILSDDFAGISDKGGASPAGMKLLRELDRALRMALSPPKDMG